ncbi:type IV secretory system conjugative DNA transfer family protein [Polaribacter cellanae]|uniref:Type IV secretory system conjugative DNA transfer family protein n=1 Tax=Polaribacter cellanae TaxID=2818493 RepID=A0A975CJK6_9FLAO|nr:type IV secretory system conjugative DNA transfer family protein [Polaribacter cellanae]QTE21081.1 type IV secretory system conjugative DNA transfer family protein [Polaribacter cellanae]
MSIIDTLSILKENVFHFLDTILQMMLGKDHRLKAGFGKASKILKRTHEGFCLDGIRSISIHQSCANVLTVAPSGKGKTQVSVFPFLLNQKGNYSIICNDPSGEISEVEPYLESVGIQTAVLDFGKKTGVYFNPLEGCKENITQMRKVAKALMNANTSEKDFFTISAEDVLVLFIQYLMESESKVYQNIANVYRLILEYQGNPQVIEKLFATKASEGVWRKFKSLAGTSDNTRKSIVASCLSAISFIGDNPTLSDITSVSTINFRDFRETPHALFIHVPVGDVQFYAPILNLFFQEFYRFAFAELPKKDDLEIFMVLDEFDTLGAIQDYSTIISNSRKAKIPQQIIIQPELCNR